MILNKGWYFEGSSVAAGKQRRKVFSSETFPWALTLVLYWLLFSVERIFTEGCGDSSNSKPYSYQPSQLQHLQVSSVLLSFYLRLSQQGSCCFHADWLVKKVCGFNGLSLNHIRQVYRKYLHLKEKKKNLWKTVLIKIFYYFPGLLATLLFFPSPDFIEAWFTHNNMYPFQVYNLMTFSKFSCDSWVKF